jgi:hypothetical protein
MAKAVNPTLRDGANMLISNVMKTLPPDTPASAESRTPARKTTSAMTAAIVNGSPGTRA